RQIVIGPPSAAAREQEGDSSKAQDLVNLFFYRVEYDGYPADATDRDPTYWRAHCLLTPFCLSDTAGNGVSGGEKELRLIGGIMDTLHAQPFVRVRNEASEEIAALQVVPSQLSVDDLNHVWATQGELPYRLSIGYEL